MDATKNLESGVLLIHQIYKVEVELNMVAESKAESEFHNIETINLAAYAFIWLNMIEGKVNEVTFEWYSIIINKHIALYFTICKMLVGEA